MKTSSSSGNEGRYRKLRYFWLTMSLTSSRFSGEDSSSRVCGLTFTHPQEALQYFKPNTYDLAILDIRMPDMTGFKLCREMKRCDPSITTCFLSAFKIQTDEFKSVFPSMDGVKAIIKKSISINELLNEMVTLLKIPAADKVAPE